MEARPLLNRYEEVTYDALNRACASDSAMVFPKVRIADVFPLDGGGVPPAHLSYALRAHFDFVVTSARFEPLFSVEFDGPLHQASQVQRHRDRLKNELCDHFCYGLLRINSRYLSKAYRGLDLLTYFVDAWFLEQAFDDAQRRKLIPYDEGFDMTFIYSNGTEDGRKWPYWLSLDIQRDMERLHRSGLIGQMAPCYYVGTDDNGNHRCLCWVVLDAGYVVVVTTGMRVQRFPAVCESELVSMLAMFDLHAAVQRAIRGDRRHLVDRHHFLAERLPAFRAQYAMRSMATVTATV